MKKEILIQIFSAIALIILAAELILWHSFYF